MNTNELAAQEQITKGLPASERPVATFARGLINAVGAKLAEVTTAGVLSFLASFSVTGRVTASTGFATGSVTITSGSATPEGAVTAVVGSLYLRTDGSTSTTLYVKTSGTGNTGWTAK